MFLYTLSVVHLVTNETVTLKFRTLFAAIVMAQDFAMSNSNRRAYVVDCTTGELMYEHENGRTTYVATSSVDNIITEVRA